MQVEKCDRCGKEEKMNSEGRKNWFDVAIIPRQRNCNDPSQFIGYNQATAQYDAGSYCPACSEMIKTMIAGFNAGMEPVFSNTKVTGSVREGIRCDILQAQVAGRSILEEHRCCLVKGHGGQHEFEP